MACYPRCAALSWDGVRPVAAFTRWLKWLAELKPQASALSVNGSALWQSRFCALAIRCCITY